MKRRWAEAGLALNTVIWGATFVVVKAALRDVSPILFLALRFTLATGILLALFHRALVSRLSRRGAGAGALTGTFLFTGYLLQTLGLRLTTPPKSAFLTGLTSVMVPFVAALVYRIRPQVFELVGVLVATGGLALMTLEGPVGAINRGDVLTLACALGFAAHIVTLGHFSEQMSFEILSVIQVAFAAAWSLSLFWWAETPRILWRPGVVCAILITGILATALAYGIQAWAQQYTSSARTALIFMLEPVFAWLTSYLLAGEGLSPRGALGAAFILGGVLLVEMKPRKSRPHPSK